MAWDILQEALDYFGKDREREGGLGTLLFPSARGHEEGMVKDLRKAIDAIAERAGWKAGEITTKVFRHTYTAARLQTLDHGAPVAPWTVARELGHSSTEMVERVYGHMGQVRHRGEEVAYRVEDFRDVLRDRLRVLEAATARA